MEDKSTANRFPWVNEQWKHQQKTSNQPKLQHIPSRFPGFLDELVENSKKSSTPIQVTPNLHAVVSSHSGTLAPTSRQGASAGATRCGSFVLNKKFEVASLHPVVSVMFSCFCKDGGKIRKNMEKYHVWQLYTFIIYTSSTAQGGGGSFKNRKPIGEVSCCESGMAERSHCWSER